MPVLTVQLPGLPPVSHVLRDETTTVGRMKGSTIVIDDRSASLMHAKITRSKDGEFFLKDLNSTNGTLVNGQTIREVKLQNFDQICFADVIAQFHAEAATAAAQPSPPLVQPLPTAPAKPQPSPEVTVRLKRSSRSSSGFDLSRVADRAVPILGGIAAFLVVAIVVWKLFLSGGRQSDTAETKPPVAVTENKTAVGSQKSEARSQKPEAVADSPAPAAKIENESVERLVAGLKDPDAAERRRAARALHSMGAEAKEAITALRTALTDDDGDVQMWAALTLVNNKSYDKTTIPILLRGLQHENPVIRQVACLSLGIIPYEGTEKEKVIAPLAERAGKDSDEEVRKAALTALNIIAPDIVAKRGDK